jgi:hypothetical protein
MPGDWTKDSADFINKLIMRKPWDRLGFNNGNNGGTKELKSHSWFASFNWSDLISKRMQSPYI